MYELFIELTDQIFWDGYAEQLAHDNPTAFQYEYNEFMNALNFGPMEHTMYLLIKVRVKTVLTDLQSASKELRAKTEFTIASTKNVRVMKSEIMELKQRTH